MTEEKFSDDPEISRIDDEVEEEPDYQFCPLCKMKAMVGHLCMNCFNGD